MNRIGTAITAVITSALLLAGCSSPASTIDKKPVDQKANINLSLKPNETGKIMVLMYHNIGKTEAEWVRAPENFRKDLQTLYEKGYRPISLSDYVTGNITTEQGKTPVVITFDDGNRNNFDYLEDGSVSSDSAVGILVDFHEQHKDFPLEATFFVNGGLPFGQKGMESKKLNYIIDKGMDIGNHTQSHVNFTKADADKIQKEIGGQAQYLQSLMGSKDYKVTTLALPYGSRPSDKSLATYLAAGNYNGQAYKNIAILNVGWNPGHSPYVSKFDNESIPRVRASETKVDNVGLYDYLDYFDKHPEEKFISDGVPDIVTVPKDTAGELDTSIKKEIYKY
ncbi:MAG: polysaccharide deacetylase family protein [Clostridiaceae bacterium]